MSAPDNKARTSHQRDFTGRSEIHHGRHPFKQPQESGAPDDALEPTSVPLFAASQHYTGVIAPAPRPHARPTRLTTTTASWLSDATNAGSGVATEGVSVVRQGLA
jgi:hypothetical protein